MSVVLVSEKSWDVSVADELDAIIGDNVIFIADKDLVTEEHLNSIQPRYVFFFIGLTIFPPVFMKILFVLYFI